MKSNEDVSIFGSLHTDHMPVNYWLKLQLSSSATVSQGQKDPNEYVGFSSWPLFHCFSSVVSKEKENSYKIFPDNLTLYIVDFYMSL